MDFSKRLRGQSAMEYLMTYGWALLVIVIVIVVLMAIMNSMGAPERCLFDQAGFTCEGPRLISQDVTVSGNTFPAGTLFAQITNGQSKAITIKRAVCLEGRTTPPTDISDWPGASVSQKLEYQESINLAQLKDSTDTEQPVQCYYLDEDTNTYKVVDLTPGTDFSGRIFLAYKMVGEASIVPPKVTSATIVVQAQ